MNVMLSFCSAWLSRAAEPCAGSATDVNTVVGRMAVQHGNELIVQPYPQLRKLLRRRKNFKKKNCRLNRGAEPHAGADRQ